MPTPVGSLDYGSRGAEWRKAHGKVKLNIKNASDFTIKSEAFAVSDIF